MRISYNILWLILILLSSCLFEDDTKQEFPKFDFDNSRKIEIRKVFDPEYFRIITDSAKIKSFANIFIDSSNYFKSEKYKKFNGNRPEYHLKFMTKNDTLQLTIYPEIDSIKTEVGFHGETLSNYVDKGIGRKFHRFFINKRILKLIKKNE